MPGGQGNNNIQNMVKATGKHYLELMVPKFEGITKNNMRKKHK